MHIFKFVKKIFHEKVEEVKWRYDPVHELWSDPRMRSALMSFYKDHPEMVKAAFSKAMKEKTGKAE